MRCRIRIIFVLAWVMVAFSTQAQQQGPETGEEAESPRRGLLDDSTQMVYGPKTTLYYYEKFFRENRGRKLEIDTSLNGFHNYEAVANT